MIERWPAPACFCCLASTIGVICWVEIWRLPSHCGLTATAAHSANPRQARNKPSTTPSSKCRSGSAATRQRSAACSTSSTVSRPTNARSVLARLTRRPGDTSVSGQGCPSAPSQPRMRLRIPISEFRSGRGVSSLMGSTTVYEEKVSDSFMASASVAVLNSATARTGGGRCVAANRTSVVSTRRARRPPRTARQKGRRITRRHRLRTVPTGKRKQLTVRVCRPGHPLSVARHVGYAAAPNANRNSRRNRGIRERRTIVARTIRATRDAIRRIRAAALSIAIQSGAIVHATGE